ncbi:unnamed protein product [Didymodactylos carnosus]|uniref:Uncharacterized protein n=1 Tax=Didymodactylos carnosus TaxID=1234261 RepID=A0A815W0R6_9BILA|nr:unnamed protein product [Didymodactylos carnosus]CAF1535846.1 unnamed protein product [Didymodactylos carnosus]CAF3750717.1 unnamed protein product [Didymodactylos carnosus]CAF4395653.1 unnamed protein product [Didymodactylos carnosus]
MAASGTRRYQIREKIFSFGDNFKIKDEYGNDQFIVRSKLFSMGDKLMLEDTNGIPLIKIRQELLHLHPTFNILAASNDGLLAVVKKKFSFLRPKFEIESSLFGSYALQGVDIFAHEFQLVKNGQVVAMVNKKIFSLSDTYGVEVAANEDQPFILSLVIVIDQILYDEKK